MRKSLWADVSDRRQHVALTSPDCLLCENRARLEQVNRGRYGLKAKGTLFPIEGPGLVPMNLSQYKALKGVVHAHGDRERRPSEFLRDSAITTADWDKAEAVYRHHPDCSAGGTS